MKVVCFLTIILFFQVAASAAVINIEFTPKHIYASRDNQVKIDVRLAADNGVGLAGKKLFVSTSRGVLSGVEDLGEGKYHAILTVPAPASSRLPGYVLVLVSAELENEATAEGVKIPVYSTLELKGHSAGGAEVYARAFGRVQGKKALADENGTFKLSIPVAPGLNVLEIVAKKNNIEKVNEVNLKIPARAWFAILTMPEAIEPDDPQGSVYIYALDKKGRPLKSPRFTLDCTPGTCSNPELLKPGLFLAKYQPPRTFRTDKTEVRVEYEGKTQLAGFKLVSTELAKLDIDADKQEAFYGEVIVFEITGYKSSGALAEASGISLSADGERVKGAVEGVGGRYRVKYKVRREDIGKVLSFAAEGSPQDEPGKVVHSREIMISIKQPNIELMVEKADVQIDPGAGSEIEIKAMDSSGSGIAGLNLNVTAEAGSIDSIQDMGRGKYKVAFTAPREWTGDTLRIDIAVPDVPGVSPVAHIFSWSASVSQETEDKAGASSQLTLTASPTRAGGGEKLSLTAGVKDENGKGVSNQIVKFTTEAGIAGDFVDAGGGKYTAGFILPETLEPGTLKIRAVCEYGQKQLNAETQIEITAPEAATIEITADNTEVYVPDTSEIRIEVIVRDKSGQGVAGQQINLSVKQGSRTETTTVESGAGGRAEAVFELLPEAGEVVAAAFLKDNPSVKTSITIRKLKYAISRIEVKASDNSLPADGTTAMEIEVLAISEAGNDAAGERIDFNLLQGNGRLNVPYCTTSDDGRCYVYYTSGVACGDVRVEAFAYREDTVRQTVSFSETAKVPTSLDLDGTLSGMTANGVDTQEVQVLVLDAGNCPVSGERLTFEVSSGSGSIETEAVTDENGLAGAIFTAGNTAETTSILVRSETSPLVMLTFVIELFSLKALTSFNLSPSTTTPVAGQPFTVTLTAIDDTVRTMTIYDPTGTTFGFYNPGAAPDSTPPKYPKSSGIESIASAFINGVASVQVTLYKVEATTLSFFGGSISETSSKLTVSPGAADVITVVSGNNQNAKVSTAVASPLVAGVTDAYGNPVSGAVVTFAVSSGGGVVSGPGQTSNANGQASPTAWTLGSSQGVNKLSAGISSGSVSSVRFTATAFSDYPPAALISLQSDSTNICKGDSVDFTGTGSSAVFPATIDSYSWDFNGDGAEDSAAPNPAPPLAYTYNFAGEYTVTLAVIDTNEIRVTDTATVNVTAAIGTMTLVASPQVLNANEVDTASIYSNIIQGCGGAAIADDTLFTVSTTLGDITTADQDAGPGIQIASSNGTINFTLQAGDAAGTAVVTATSVDGDYTDEVSVEIGIDNTRPFAVSHSPSGYLTENVDLITIVFSEAMTVSELLDPDVFYLKQDKDRIDGTRSYDSGTFTLTFTPDELIDVSKNEVTVKVEKSATDLSGNKLDGKYDRKDEDKGVAFEFKFGSVKDQMLPTSVCNGDDPDPFSPDGVDGPGSQSDTTTIRATVNDNDKLKFWRLTLFSGGTEVRTYGGEAKKKTTDVTKVWDGRNQAGEILANGLYTYEVTAFDKSYNESLPCSGVIEIANPISFNRFGP